MSKNQIITISNEDVEMVSFNNTVIVDQVTKPTTKQTKPKKPTLNKQKQLLEQQKLELKKSAQKLVDLCYDARMLEQLNSDIRLSWWF